MFQRIFCAMVMVSWILLPVSIADDGPKQEEANVSPESTDSKTASGIDTNWNLPTKTIGGAQLWTDYCHRGGDRLQKHAIIGHWRLIDEDDVRQTWGTREQCQAVLDQRHPRGDSISQQDSNGDKAAKSDRHVIVLLHGLMRTQSCMKALQKSLAEEGFPDAIRFSYASTRASIGDHAEALRQTLEDYPEGTRFSFVGHSMGNIVVRHMIGDLQREGDPKNILPRCRSMVMLGPPNHGASISRRLAPTGLYGLVTGKGGLELGPEWESFRQNLATPPFPFAIIAGDVSGGLIKNPLLKGAGDFVVSVDEANLEGREWLKTVPVLHSFLMNDLVTISMTVDFIKAHDD